MKIPEHYREFYFSKENKLLNRTYCSRLTQEELKSSKKCLLLDSLSTLIPFILNNEKELRPNKFVVSYPVYKLIPTRFQPFFDYFYYKCAPPKVETQPLLILNFIDGFSSIEELSHFFEMTVPKENSYPLKIFLNIELKSRDFKSRSNIYQLFQFVNNSSKKLQFVDEDFIIKTQSFDQYTLHMFQDPISHGTCEYTYQIVKKYGFVRPNIENKEIIKDNFLISPTSEIIIASSIEGNSELDYTSNSFFKKEIQYLIKKNDYYNICHLLKRVINEY